MWKNHFRVGIPAIDKQHEELFCKVADFLLAVRQEGPWEDKLPQVKATMAFMEQYVIVHFHDEEEYQRTIHYPQHEEHRQIHDEFRSSIRQSIENLEHQGYEEAGLEELGDRLLDWLINHVMASDLKMAQYAKDASSTRN